MAFVEGATCGSLWRRGIADIMSVGRSQGKSNGFGRVDNKGQGSFRKEEALKPNSRQSPKGESPYV